MTVPEQKQRSALRRALAAACFALCLSGHADAQEPRRVVSANLCADQLLLALADPRQIVSLSPFARDKDLSFLSDAAQRYPANRGSAEELIEMKPDLVLIGSFDSRHARAMLERRRIAFVLLEPWRDFEQGQQQIHEISRRLGQASRGEAILAHIDASLRRLAALARTRTTAVSALVLHRRGYVLHSGVIVELARIAGLDNAAENMGLQASSTVPLERIVATPPDYLIVTRPPAPPSDQGEAFLSHSALARLFPPEKRLVVPDNLSICAGPATPALIDRLADEIEAKVR